MLTPTQQATLDYHLRETNLLTNEELIMELTDHYTTALTERMRQNMTFETALSNTQIAFGGQKGLQKMERQYNRVTFRHYDERWRQMVADQFRTPLVWRWTLPAYLLILTLSWFVHKPTSISNFFYGGVTGAIVGSSFIWLNMLWPYLKMVPFRGWHNVPAEVLYLMKRHALFLMPFYVIGGIGQYMLTLLPYPVSFVLISLYLLVYYLFIRTSRIMYDSLYDVDTVR